MSGFHKHRCDRCTTVWEHSNACGDVAQLCVALDSHKCPHCGEIQWVKYFGPAPVRFVGECVLGPDERYNLVRVVPDQLKKAA